MRKIDILSNLIYEHHDTHPGNTINLLFGVEVFYHVPSEDVSSCGYHESLETDNVSCEGFS